MDERTEPQHPGCLTFAGGRVPDGQPGPYGVPEPPRPVKAGMRRSEQVGWSLVPVVAVAVISLRVLGVLP